MGSRGRNTKENIMALQPTLVCCQPALQRCEHQDCRRPHGTFKHNHDREISPCGWQPETGCNSFSRLYQLRYAVVFTPWHSRHFGTLWWTLRPTSEGSSFPSVILSGFWFGLAGVHICEVEPTRIIKAMKNNNIENAKVFEKIQRLWTLHCCTY